MHARVTAILIAHNGAQWLPRTLAALDEQTRHPDTLIAVSTGSNDGSGRILSEAAPTHMLDTQSRLSFGTAVSHALGVLPPATDDNEWLWLLSHDSAPEPGALAALLATVEVNPSVGIAGPKQMDGDAPAFIREFGETMTRFGASFQLAERELDQAQHDRLSDVLGVGAAGMLVRRTLWEQLKGFDPALPTADNGLDFSIRTRLAGSRVVAVPAARVLTGGSGYSGPGDSARGSARRKRYSARRAAQLHRRLVYAPTAAVPLHWISLVPLALLRSLFHLVRKQPGAIGPELAAAFKTAFSGRVGEARRTLRSTAKTGWKALASLRIPGDEVRRRRALQRELALSRSRGAREPVQFVSTGGLTTVVLAAVAGLVVFLPLLGAHAVAGGGLLPLSANPGALWSHVGYGWRDIGLGLVGGADPFAYVLAVLGTLTFWSPSFSITLLYLTSFPLAALAAWFCASYFTTRAWARVVAAVLWVLAPPFLSALTQGELGGVLVHLLLPWLILSGAAARKSWSASAISALLFAAITACSPSLWPALVLLWLVATATAGRDVMRLIGVPIPAFALFLPLGISQFGAGNPLGLLADPGVPVPHSRAGFLDLLVGLPSSGSGGWLGLTPVTGLDAGVTAMLLVVLLVPLALLALTSLAVAPIGRAAVAVLLAAAGFATAVGADHLAVQTVAGEPVFLWPGAGLSLYWLGLAGAATLALGYLPRLVPALSVVASVVLVLVVLPLLASSLAGTAAIRQAAPTQLPAFVTAEAAANPRVGTLALSANPDGSVVSEVKHGRGSTLDDQSTLSSTRSALGSTEHTLAKLIGDLSSTNGASAVPGLTQLGVEFILLAPAFAEGPGASTVTHLRNSLDGNAALTPIGDTLFGQLWQVSQPGLATLPEPKPSNLGSTLGVFLLVLQILVFGVTLLLALPAGRLEAPPAGFRRPRGSRAVADAAAVTAPDGATPAAGTSVAESTLDAYSEPEGEQDSIAETTGEDERV